MNTLNKIDLVISGEVLSIGMIEGFISDPSCGGKSIFIGSVRDQTKNKKVLRLEFEAYEAMALKEMEKICAFALTAWPIKKMAIHHRTGLVSIGEAAVIIGVSSAHRDAAIQACSYAIDTLKKNVPIWKKEIFEDGEVWVAAHP